MRNKVYFGAYVVISGLFVYVNLRLAPNPQMLQHYRISQAEARLANLAIVFPLLLVLAAALYGFLRFKSYAKSIESSPEGAPFNHLATGLTIQAFSLPLLATASSVASYLGYRHPDLLPTLTILKNYLNVLFPLFAVAQLYKGAEMLIHTLKRKLVLPYDNWALLGTIVLTTVYIWLITTRAYGPTGDVVYYLPNWLVITTLAIPYIFVWCYGLATAYYLNRYQQTIKGKIYKQSLRYLAQGIVGIIILSICIQFITTVSARLTRLNLTPLLGLVYLLVALYAVGYGLVARGARKLKLIEEV